MKKFLVLALGSILLCAASACSSDSGGGAAGSDGGGAAGSGGGAAGSGGGAGSGGTDGGGAGGDYQGTCDRPAEEMCVDNYCSGSSCANLLESAKSSCKGTWSQTACKSGALAKCTMVTMGWTASTSYYTGIVSDIKSACESFGGTFSQ
ncbi:MAG: hypothetical protein HY898_15255 [Deltaproteobacteria bacterium]|nr:hypothetical protein [Deltaproteobacteria bacterium]